MYRINLEKLKEIRLQKRWRKVDLSRLLSPKSKRCPIRYYRVEKGTTKMTINDLLILAEAFEMAPEELLREIISREEGEND